MDRTIYCPYNETFGFYTLPKAGKRAQAFIDQRNVCKGGHWVLHSKEQYQDWFRRKGQYILNLELMGGACAKVLR